MPMNRPEYNTRSYCAEFRAGRAEGGAPIIECYFALFDVVTEIQRGHFEKLAPGAFDGCEERDVRALIDHDSRLVLGRTTVGTLKLTLDETGLYGVIEVNEKDGDAMNLYARVQRGDVSQCSFGFDIDSIDYETMPDGRPLDVIRHVILYEVSVVTFPAYEETSAEARSLRDAKRRADHLMRWKKEMKRRLHRNGSEDSDAKETA